MAENDNKGPVKASPGGKPSETFSTNNWNGRSIPTNDHSINKSRKSFPSSKNSPSKSSPSKKGK